MRFPRKIRSGFSLVELVVVILILGILAAIAAPRAFQTSKTANDNGVRQSLSVIRSLIDTYAAQHNGALPGANSDPDTFKADLKPLLRGRDFPMCNVGGPQNSEVRMMSSSESPGQGGSASTHSWAYNIETGDFYINSTEVSGDGVTTYDTF